MNRIGSFIAALVVAIVADTAHAQSAAADYETAPRLSPDRVLTPALLASGNHRVRDEIKARQYWLEFEIESDFGNYRVLSLPMVALRVHEIRTLAQAVDEFRRGNQILAETLRGQLTVGADSFVDILTSPVSTTTQIVSQFGSNVVQTFDELRERPSEREQTEDSERTLYHRFEPGDPILASHKRNVASQLNLDVYSTNPKVQEFLDTVAAARGAGQQSAGVVTISLPRNHEVRVAGGRVESTVRTAMTHNTINQLYARNLQRLGLAGVEMDLANAFLSHPLLSPWHKTTLTERVVLLDGVDERGALLRAALSAKSEADALAYLQVGKMLSAFQERTGSLRSLVNAGHIVLATTDDGALLVMLPFDVVYWDRETERVFSGLGAFARERGFRRHVIISASVITDAARRGLTDLGFELEEKFLLRR